MSLYKVGQLADFFNSSSEKIREKEGSESSKKFEDIYSYWMESTPFAEFEKPSSDSTNLKFGRFIKKAKQNQSKMLTVEASANSGPKSGKKNKKGKKGQNSSEMAITSDSMDTCESKEVVNVKKNKKNKAKGIAATPKLDQLFDGIVSDEQDEVSDEDVVPKQKKRKAGQGMDLNSESANVSHGVSGKKRKKNLVTESADAQSDADDSAAEDAISVTKNKGEPKKNKKRKRSQQASVDDEEQTPNLEDVPDVTNDTPKDKKDKKKKTRSERRKLARAKAEADASLNGSNDKEESDDAESDEEADESPKKKRSDAMGNDEASDELGESMSDESDEEPQKKKEGDSEGTEDDESDEAESKLKLSKKEAKLLKKKNKNSEEPEGSKFSVKVKEESAFDAFARTPNSKRFGDDADSDERTERTLFVGNIPGDADKEAITALFEPFGTVSDVRILSAIPGKFGQQGSSNSAAPTRGFVEFENKEDAEKALSLNGTEFNGNTLRVDKSFPKRQSNQFGGRSQDGGGGGRPQRDSTGTIFLGNLPYQLEDQTVFDTFASCGKVKSVRVIRDSAGAGKGFGFVEFEDPGSIESALALDGTEIDGRQINIKRSENRGSGGGGPQRFQRGRGTPRGGRNFGGRGGGGFRKFDQHGGGNSGNRNSYKKFD